MSVAAVTGIITGTNNRAKVIQVDRPVHQTVNTRDRGAQAGVASEFIAAASQSSYPASCTSSFPACSPMVNRLRFATTKGIPLWLCQNHCGFARTMKRQNSYSSHRLCN
jgi:hypothetical protein